VDVGVDQDEDEDEDVAGAVQRYEAEAYESPAGVSRSADPVLVHRELMRLCLSGEQMAGLATPRFVLSRHTVRDCLTDCHRTLTQAVRGTGLQYRLGLSIKTQPHRMVLEEARQAHFCPEVISSAEMHTALEAGWALDQVIMNGPAKWWDPRQRRLPAKREHAGLQTPECERRVMACFADSLADLHEIVTAINDPGHWLDARVVGLRFGPSGQVRSRFGLNTLQPGVLRQAAELLQQLPAHVEVGLHFHYASSTVGLERWFALARAFVAAGAGLNELCKRPVRVLDLGSGWPAHLLNDAVTQPKLAALLREAVQAVPGLHTVMMEPGKIVTERAGGLLTRVQIIREMATREQSGLCAKLRPGTQDRVKQHAARPLESLLMDPSSPQPSSPSDCESAPTSPWRVTRVVADSGREVHVEPSTTHASEDDSSNDDESSVDMESVAVVANNAAKVVGVSGDCDLKFKRDPRIAVVDACICDLGSLPTHTHPVLWFSAADQRWRVLGAGKDVVYGRICMEFDVVAADVELPACMGKDDFLLVGFTGAYDMTMSYPFGDGVQRDCDVVVPNA
jgi:diaminopimelate decarboxylase